MTDDTKTESELRDEIRSEITFLEALPPTRQYIREEWNDRTWWGRITVLPEAVLLAIVRTLLRIHAAAPATYKDKN